MKYMEKVQKSAYKYDYKNMSAFCKSHKTIPNYENIHSSKTRGFVWAKSFTRNICFEIDYL